MMKRRRTKLEQEPATTKHVTTTITSMENIGEDDETVKLRFCFANKTKFVKKFQKDSWEYFQWSQLKKTGDEVLLITCAGIIQDIYP